MKIYTCSFIGHWPIGACALIFATGSQDAEKRMRAARVAEGLDETQDLEFDEMDMNSAKAHILLNGDY